MNKLYLTILTALLAVGLSSCSKDECDQQHLNNLAHFPNVLKGTFPTESQVLNLGETLKITPELLNPEGVTYSWLVNGKEVSTEATFNYEIEKPCRGELTCIISNKYGKVEMKTSFSSNHDFSKGFFYVADHTFNFYDTEKQVVYKDCIGSLNSDMELTPGGFNVSKSNGKFYILVKTSSSNTNHFFVIDAKTLHFEKSAEINANLIGISILDDNFGLVSGSGVWRVNLNSLNNVRLKNENMFNLYNSMIYNNKLLSNDTYSDASNVKYYNVNELLAAKENEMPAAATLDITQSQKINFVLGKDGNAYTLENTNTGCNIVKIKSDLTTEKVSTSFQPAKGLYWTSPTVGIAASETENIIYIPSSDGAIYKYVIGDAHSLNAPFITSHKSGLPIAATLQIDKQTGDLYVVYGKQYENYKIVVYHSDGTEAYTVDCGESAPTQLLFNN